MQDCEEPRSRVGSANFGDNFTVCVGRGICFANITAAGRLTSTEGENSIPNGDISRSLVFSEGFSPRGHIQKQAFSVRSGSIYPALPCLDNHDGTSRQNVLKSEKNSPHLRLSGMK